MRKMRSIKKMLWMLVLPVLFLSCESKLDEHYETPSWLKGSAWEVLEARGNYSIFLEGIERAGYKQIVAGKSILTIMAPDNDAFKAYFTAHNINSLGDLNDVELKKLIGFHIMYYSYNTDKMINFRPEGDGLTEDQSKVGAGLFYKHRTKSSDPIETVYDAKEMRNYKVYHSEHYLPIFSYKMFQTKGINAKAAYEYFFPNSSWTGDQSFNISNANVIGNEEVTDNGYVYTVGQVLEPLKTIYDVLKGQQEYSKFLSLYDGYSYYLYDENATMDYGNGDSLFYHKHEAPLADIACEWPVSSYLVESTLSSVAHSIFAPSNDALDKFFNQYWKGNGYEKLDDVSKVAMQYLLYNCVYTASGCVFPEEIKSGKIINSLNAAINFNVDALPAANRIMCSNGALYELTMLEAPAMFTSVTGPAFKNKDYSNYLYMLDAANMTVALASKEARFTILMPDDKQIKNMGYEMIEDVLCDINNENQKVSASVMRNIVNLHTVTGGSGIAPAGTQVLASNNPLNFWFVKNGKITTNTLFNQILETVTGSEPDPFIEIKAQKNDEADWTNGTAYSYNSDEILTSVDPTVKLTQKLVTNDNTYKYYYFSTLLKKADLITYSAEGVGSITIGGARNLYFIPTNEAFQKAATEGRIPGIGAGMNWADASDTVACQQKLRVHMIQYIIPFAINNLSTYPYIGSGINGFYNTLIRANNEYYTLQIIDDGGKLSVRPALGIKPHGPVVDVVDTYDYFPFAYSDGCVHFIEDVLTINN